MQTVLQWEEPLWDRGRSWPVIAGSNAVIPLTVILVVVDFLKGSITELLRVRLNANVHRKFIPLSFTNWS